MQLGMIGLGRMGANMVRRLMSGGHECVVFDISPQAVADLAKEKAVGAASLEELAAKLIKPFIELHGGTIWVRSEVGAGSTFTFTLPLATDQHHLVG